MPISDGIVSFTQGFQEQIKRKNKSKGSKYKYKTEMRLHNISFQSILLPTARSINLKMMYSIVQLL